MQDCSQSLTVLGLQVDLQELPDLWLLLASALTI